MANNGKQPAADQKIDFTDLVNIFEQRQSLQKKFEAQQRALYEGSKPPSESDQFAKNAVSDEEHAEWQRKQKQLKIAQAALDARRSGLTGSGSFPPPRSRSTPNMQDTSVTGGEASIGGGGGPAVPSTAHTDGTVGFEHITYLPSQGEIDRVNFGAPSSNESGDGGNP
ncbi:hypothetical protein QFC24_000007 [Naganishia onofrii]|uniref:Uncharacterized protein n=1 Tax=Naganishia onofrii TaxID=1851511 RepID=A0ACC2XWL4_9TREE|nr:hypothetical protein QFC24_000007 [Naganishia onofrii]